MDRFVFNHTERASAEMVSRQTGYCEGVMTERYRAKMANHIVMGPKIIQWAERRNSGAHGAE